MNFDLRFNFFLSILYNSQFHEFSVNWIQRLFFFLKTVQPIWRIFCEFTDIFLTTRNSQFRKVNDFWPRVSTRGHCLHFVSQKKHRLFHFIMSSCDTWQVTVFNCHNIVDLVICFVTKSLSNNFCHKTHDKFISSHNSLLIHHHSKKYFIFVHIM